MRKRKLTDSMLQRPKRIGSYKNNQTLRRINSPSFNDETTTKTQKNNSVISNKFGTNNKYKYPFSAKNCCLHAELYKLKVMPLTRPDSTTKSIKTRNYIKQTLKTLGDLEPKATTKLYKLNANEIKLKPNLRKCASIDTIVGICVYENRVIRKFPTILGQIQNPKIKSLKKPLNSCDTGSPKPHFNCSLFIIPLQTSWL